MYRLASEVHTGAIVELGVWHGCGTVTMALASGQQVYGVDDYNHTGWAGEEYTSEDEWVFWGNVDKAGVEPPPIMLNRDAAYAGEHWHKWGYPAIALHHWDLGCNKIMLVRLVPWLRDIQQGGVEAVHETMDQRLGSKDLPDAIDESWSFDGRYGGGVWVWVKE